MLKNDAEKNVEHQSFYNIQLDRINDSLVDGNAGKFGIVAQISSYQQFPC